MSTGDTETVAVRERSAQTALEALALAVAGALPGVAVADIVSGNVSIGLGAAVAVLAATAAAWVCRLAGRAAGPGRWRWPMVVAAAVLGAVASATAAAALWPGNSARTLPAAVLDGLTHGWAWTVTAPVPAELTPRLAVPLVVVVWLATFSAVALARRSTSRLLPLLPVAVAFVLSSVAAGRAQNQPLLIGATFVVAAAVVLVLRTPRPPSTGRARNRATAYAAGASILVVAAIAALAGPVLALGRDDDPFEPRDHIDPPRLPAAAESPLDLVASNLRQPDVDLFTIDASERVPIRLVTLDSFDGATWQVSGEWETAGPAMRVPRRSVAIVHEVSADVSIPDDGLSGAFLPTLGDTRSVRGIDAIVEPASGSLAVTGDADIAGSNYSIVADYATLDGVGDGRISALEVATDDEADTALELGERPPQLLVDVAARAVDGQTSPMIQAILLTRYLSNSGSFSLDVGDGGRGGHSYYHLLRTLTETHSGTSEQFATAFAVLGRIVGLPTRVVVGFRVDDDATGPVTVQSGDVVVWPEVKFEGAGWVSFDPTPTEAGSDSPEPVVNIGGAAVPVAAAEPETTTTTTSTAPPPAGDRDAESGDADGGLSTFGKALAIALVAGAALVVITALVGTVVIALKRRITNRRRRSGDSRQQVLGAWHDVLDRLSESGAAEPGTRTVEEHVAAAGTDTDSLAPLTVPVTRALYGESPLAPADAERAWASRDEFVRAQRSGESWSRRWRRAARLRTLVHPAGAAK